MTEPRFDNASELLKEFDLGQQTEFHSVRELNDRKVGFSVQRDYPDDLLYLPPRKPDGTKDTVALIHVVYLHPTEESKSFNSHKVPLIVRITTYSKYLSNHFDYNFQDDNCPTKESVEKSHRTPVPLELQFPDDFFYDHHTGIFLDSELNPISGLELLEKVFGKHCDTSHASRGKGIRRKLKFQSLSLGVLATTIQVMKWVLSALFGRTLDESEKYFAYLEGYERSSFKKLSTDSLDVFGYKASRRVIILFCFLCAFAYWGVSISEGDYWYINQIIDNSFLAFIHSLLLIWCLDVVVPEVIFVAINKLTALRKYMAFRKFKV